MAHEAIGVRSSVADANYGRHARLVRSLYKKVGGKKGTPFRKTLKKVADQSLSLENVPLGKYSDKSTSRVTFHARNGTKTAFRLREVSNHGLKKLTLEMKTTRNGQTWLRDAMKKGEYTHTFKISERTAKKLRRRAKSEAGTNYDREAAAAIQAGAGATYIYKKGADGKYRPESAQFSDLHLPNHISLE